MPGFYGYSKESFPLEWELAPNNTINVRLEGELAAPEFKRKLWAMMPNPFFPKEEALPPPNGGIPENVVPSIG